MHFLLECFHSSGNIRLWCIEGDYEDVGFGVRRTTDIYGELSKSSSFIGAYDFKNKKEISYKIINYDKSSHKFVKESSYSGQVGGEGAGDVAKNDVAPNCVILLKNCTLKYSVYSNYSFNYEKAVDWQNAKQDNFYQSCDLKYLVRRWFPIIFE